MAVKIPVVDVRAVESSYVPHSNDVPIQTPAGRVLSLPTKRLAEAVAQERWHAYGKKPVPPMPLTQLAATALDIVAPEREKILDSMVSFIGTELLCYRAEKNDPLAERQESLWQPFLDSFKARYDVTLKVGTGLMPLRQHPENAEVLRKILAAHDAFFLTGLRYAAEIMGSLVLALALAKGEKKAEELFHAAELEALFQLEKWGTDPVTEGRLNEVRKDLGVCENWFAVLRDTESSSPRKRGSIS